MSVGIVVEHRQQTTLLGVECQQQQSTAAEASQTALTEWLRKQIERSDNPVVALLFQHAQHHLRSGEQVHVVPLRNNQ